METYNMMNSSMSLEEISKKRNLKMLTIQDHIIRCASEGSSIDWNRFINHEHEKIILKAVNDTGSYRLKPIKEAVSRDIDYMELKCVLCKHKLNENG